MNLEINCPLMDNEDNLRSPSNGTKLGYDMERLIIWGKLDYPLIAKIKSQYEMGRGGGGKSLN